MGLKPLHDWVLIRRDESEERTAGGIIIPASARSEPSRGVVEAIGPGMYKKEHGRKEERFVPTVLKPGQRVFFPQYAARDAELDGGEVTLVREEDILGTLEGQPKPPEEKHSRAGSRKEQPPVEINTANRVKAVHVKKTVPKTKPGKTAKPRKAVKRPAAPKRKTTTAPAKRKGDKKEKTKRPAARKTSTGTARKKTKTIAKKTATKKPAAKKTAPKRTVSTKKTLRKTSKTKTAGR